jgi:hypothetical protein
MLLRVCFLVLALSIVAETLLEGAGALAVAALHRQAVGAAANAYSDAVQRAQAAVAAAIVAGSPLPSDLPSPEPTCALAGASGCALLATESVTLATESPTACPSSGCASYTQSNDLIAEGRAFADVAATVTNATGRVIATRSATVVFRTLRIAPYAVPAGALDTTLDDAEDGAGGAGGLIDVVYENATTGALMPANVWTVLAPQARSASAWSP